jgi:hypothetical protein
MKHDILKTESAARKSKHAQSHKDGELFPVPLAKFETGPKLAIRVLPRGFVTG